MKKTIDLIKSKRISLNLPFSLALIAFASLALTFFMLWLQPDGLGDIIKCIVENKGLSLFLNWLPVVLLMVFLYFAFNSAALSITAAGALGILMAVVNRYKILLRNDPFLPWDISLGGEVMGIAKSFGASMIIIAAALIIFYMGFSVFCAWFFKSGRINFYLRIAVCAACIGAALFVNKPLYKNAKINAELYVIGNVYNQTATFNSKGFLYSFIYTYNTNKITKPDGYDAASVLAQIENSDNQGVEALLNKKKPHIIMVMGEAFCEISLNEHFDFSDYSDPLENYKIIKEESIYGNLVVPNLGGGTADTEFDTLTGLSTRHLRGAPFSFRLIGGEFEALPSVLNSIGYRSEAMHPGYAWFYNRQNVFKHFGFETSLFLDAFEGVENKGMYINEASTIDRLIEMYEANKADYPNTPYYNFTVTIQNHGPYKDKYGAGANFSTDAPLDEDDINAISNYFEGLMDADKELGRLADYFRSEDEPVVLIYFGDHLPAFNPHVYSVFYPDIYDEGTLRSLTRLYKTPFIIWQNDAAKAISAIDENFEKAPMPEDMVISSNYLGAYVLELLGYENISPFMDYVNELRAVYPVITESQSFTMDGESSANMTAEEKADLILYRNWEFYKIFDE